MKGLLIKDFKILAEQKRFFVMVFGFGIFFMISNGEPSSGIGYITMLFTILTLSTISYDEHDNGMAFLMTLPITRNAYVKEKYLFAGIIALVSATVSSVLAILASNWMGSTLDWIELLATGGIMILFSMFILAITIPVQIKYGAEKGRIAMLLIGGGFFALLVLLAKGKEYFGIDLSPVITWMKKLDGWVLLIIAVLTVLCFILGSYIISTNIIKKKEF